MEEKHSPAPQQPDETARNRSEDEGRPECTKPQGKTPPPRPFGAGIFPDESPKRDAESETDRLEAGEQAPETDADEVAAGESQDESDTEAMEPMDLDDEDEAKVDYLVTEPPEGDDEEDGFEKVLPGPTQEVHFGDEVPRRGGRRPARFGGRGRPPAKDRKRPEPEPVKEEGVSRPSGILGWVKRIFRIGS